MTVVFFDVDKTLVKNTTVIAIVKYYLHNGHFGLTQIFWAIIYKILYSVDLVKPMAMMQRGLKPFIGRPRKEVQTELQEVFEKYIKSSFYQEALDLIKEHQNTGNRVVLLTSTSWDIAKAIADYLQLEYIASAAVTENGIYTDQIKLPVPYGEGKMILARQFCENHGYTLEEAFFYTDSHSDLQLLQAVGHPVCVNPDIRLLLKAKRFGWPILKFKFVHPDGQK
ncbi:HAD family hydrolase [candidate division CSSED10-310 bacterium]|uniref:HAD family hydrolase n=1 Tax=candidate division CSSED10-310 bacterium TaxID=2855610 RepID=A0ABV6YX54_UNCC1